MMTIKLLDREISDIPHTISIIGLAKNVGKTTVLNHIIDTVDKDIEIGISSTGWDGEAYDSVTGRPKPKIILRKGMTAATTDECLSRSDSCFEVIEELPMRTSLGRVLIIKVLSQGRFEIAGPSTVSELIQIKHKLIDYGCKLILFDGAINRKASSSVKICDSIIISSGLNAGYSLQDVKGLTIFWKTIYTLPVFARFAPPAPKESKFSLYSFDGKYRASSDSPEELLCGESGVVFVRGAFSERTCEAVSHCLTGCEIVADESSSLFLNPVLLKLLSKKNRGLFVKDRVPIRGISLNPVSASHRFESLYFFEEMKEICRPCDTWDVVAGLSAIY